MTDEQIDALLPGNPFGGTSLSHFNVAQVRQVVRAAIAALAAPAPAMVDERELIETLSRHAVADGWCCHDLSDEAMLKIIQRVRAATRPTLQSLGGDAGVSEEWKLVPPVPTEAMVRAAAGAPESSDAKQDIENMWSAMLDAVAPAGAQEYRVSAGVATGWSPWFPGDGNQFEKSYQVERRRSAPSPAVAQGPAAKPTIS